MTPPSGHASDGPPPRRGERVILAFGLILALALPGLAWWHLDRRIDRDLEAAISGELGVSASIGEITAGPTGELVIRDLRLGGVLSVDRVAVAIDPMSLFSGSHDTTMNRAIRAIRAIRIDRPRGRIAPGDAELAGLVAAIRARVARTNRDASHRASSPPPAGDTTRSSETRPASRASAILERLSLRDGELILDLGPRGTVQLQGISVAPSPHVPAAVRVVAAHSAIDVTRGPYRLVGHFERAAADVGVAGVSRFLADGGELQVTTETGTGTGAAVAAVSPVRARVVELTVQRGIDDDRLVVRGEMDAVPRPGRFEAGVDVKLGPRLAVDIDLAVSELPLGLADPLLPRSLDLSSALATGSARIRLLDGDEARVRGGFAIRGAVVDDRRVADGALVVSGTTEVEAAMGPHDGAWRVELTRLGLTTGALALDLSGEVRFPTSARQSRPDRRGVAGRSWLPDSGHLRLVVPDVPCQSALEAVPAAMRDQLSGLAMSGDFRATAALRFDRADVSATALDLELDVDDCRVAREADADPSRLRRSFAHRFPDGSRAIIGRDQATYVSLRRIPRHVVGAFVASEDGSFYRHDGFDLRQIERSLAVNLRDSAFVRGGSTISQQLVKNVFLSHRRNLARKLQEAVLTWRLETRLSKPEILERYLNIIQLGPDVFGVGRAAEHWFGKSARRLTPRESAFLAALTPAPNTISRRVTRHGSVDPRTAKRIDSVLLAMRRHGVITDRDYRRARDTRLSLRRDLLARR